VRLPPPTKFWDSIFPLDHGDYLRSSAQIQRKSPDERTAGTSACGNGAAWESHRHPKSPLNFRQNGNEG
jgi:hypothetical protein